MVPFFAKSSFQNLLRKTLLRSDTIDLGIPWSRTISCMKNSATLTAECFAVRLPKWQYFVRKSTTMTITDCPPTVGKTMMKSMLRSMLMSLLSADRLDNLPTTFSQIDSSPSKRTCHALDTRCDNILSGHLPENYEAPLGFVVANQMSARRKNDI